MPKEIVFQSSLAFNGLKGELEKITGVDYVIGEEMDREFHLILKTDADPAGIIAELSQRSDYFNAYQVPQ